MKEVNDRQLNEKESLELITNMIRNTRQRMEEGSGTMFLIWGYVTIIVTMAVWGIVSYTGNYRWQFAWFLLPILGYTIAFFYKKQRAMKPRATTYIDRVIRYIWVVLGIAGFLLSVISIMHRLPILFIIVLIMGIGITLSGLIINFRPLVISGALGMATSIVLTFLSWNIQLPAFAFIFLFMTVIPGHYLNYKARKNNV